MKKEGFKIKTLKKREEIMKAVKGWGRKDRMNKVKEKRKKYTDK